MGYSDTCLEEVAAARRRYQQGSCQPSGPLAVASSVLGGRSQKLWQHSPGQGDTLASRNSVLHLYSGFSLPRGHREVPLEPCMPNCAPGPAEGGSS